MYEARSGDRPHGAFRDAGLVARRADQEAGTLRSPRGTRRDPARSAGRDAAERRRPLSARRPGAARSGVHRAVVQAARDADLYRTLRDSRVGVTLHAGWLAALRMEREQRRLRAGLLDHVGRAAARPTSGSRAMIRCTARTFPPKSPADALPPG